VVVTDFYGWSEMVLEEGDLLPALAATAALPAVFRPVRVNGRVMVDGGVTNPLPFDQLDEDVDLVIAVDVIGGPIDRHGRTPGPTETVFGSTQLFMQSIMAQKLRHPRAPDILIRPPANGRVLDFLKASRIIEAAEPVREQVKRRVDEAIGALSAAGR
jgi:NTE family protein